MIHVFIHALKLLRGTLSILLLYWIESGKLYSYILFYTKKEQKCHHKHSHAHRCHEAQENIVLWAQYRQMVICHRQPRVELCPDFRSDVRHYVRVHSSVLWQKYALSDFIYSYYHAKRLSTLL